MSWSRENPRYRRSSALIRRKKKKSFLKRLDNWWKGRKKASRAETGASGEGRRPAAPQSSPAADELKIAVPRAPKARRAAEKRRALNDPPDSSLAAVHQKKNKARPGARLYPAPTETESGAALESPWTEEDGLTIAPVSAPPSLGELDDGSSAAAGCGPGRSPAQAEFDDDQVLDMVDPHEAADNDLAAESTLLSVAVELDRANVRTIPASLYLEPPIEPGQVRLVDGDDEAEMDPGPPTLRSEIDPYSMGDEELELWDDRLESDPVTIASDRAGDEYEDGEYEDDEYEDDEYYEDDRAEADAALDDGDEDAVPASGETEDGSGELTEAPAADSAYHRRSARFRRRGPIAAALDRSAALRWALVAGLAGLLIAGIAFTVSYFSGTEPPTAKVARIPMANLPKVQPLAPGFFEIYAQGLESAIQTEATVDQGSSLGKALESVGLGVRQKSAAIIECLSRDGGIKPGMVRAGVTLRAYWADRSRDELRRLEYHPETGAAPLVVMPRADGGFWLYDTASPALTISAAREGEVETSLWKAASDAGLDAGVIKTISGILASDVDFMTDIKKGASFQVLFSRDYRDGRPQGAPIIDMIKLVNAGRSYEYYRFVDDSDKPGYFDPDGRTSLKTFFVSPLQYTRISSGFTMNRLHPIHKVVRPHQGVDYAAPSGTPVSTVADGTVIFAGWNGGYGRLVTIKHDDTYTTMYAHLSRFAPGIQKGRRVKQGDLIGHVGATGTATGPHLDFRLKKNGVFINPIPELAAQKGHKLSPADLIRFSEAVGLIQQRMTEQLPAARSGG